MSEQDQTGQSRRERRRAAQSETEAAETDATDAEQGSESSAVGPEVPETGSVVEENRKARRAAAAKRRAKREQSRPAPATGLDAGEVVDDALARGSDAVMKWFRRHFNVMQWVIVLGVGGWFAWEIYSWRTEKNVAKASDALVQGIRSEHAEDSPQLDKAAESYRAAQSARDGSTTAMLAKLALAGVLYDQGKYGDAIALYQEVAGSELAKVDPDARGRALEGVALSLEAKGDVDGALKKYGELENADVPGFNDLARYHQARLSHKKGDDARAKELLVKLIEKFNKSDKDKDNPLMAPPKSYVEQSARDLLESIDPKALPEPTPSEALQRALQQFQKQLPPGVSMPGPGSVPIPEAPAVPEAPPATPEAPPATPEAPAEEPSAPR